MKKILVCFLSVMLLIGIVPSVARANVLHVAAMDEGYLQKFKNAYEAEQAAKAKAAAATKAESKKKENSQPSSQSEPTQQSKSKKVATGKYSAADVDLLYKITHAESRGEGQKGQMAVVNVVLNRVKSSKFPNSIRGVIYQRGQFTPVSSGGFSSIKPSSQVKASVDKVLAGERVFGDEVLYFRSARSSTKWGKYKLIARIGKQLFYAG